MSNSWQIDSIDLFIIFILLSITNLGSTCTPLKSDFGFIESCRIYCIVTPQGLLLFMVVHVLPLFRILNIAHA